MRRGLFRLIAAVLILGGVAIRLLRLKDNAPSAGNGAHPSESWSTPLWEPFKVAIAAMYALCLQRCYETVIAVLHASPAHITSFRSFPTVGDAHLVLLYQTIGYVTWLSLNFLYNMGLYLLIPPDPTRRRLWGHAQLTVSLGLFYLFGATVGKPSHKQLVLILGLLFLDSLFPLLMSGVLAKRIRLVWFVRGCIQFAGVFWIGWRFTEPQLKDPGFSLFFMVLMLTQLLIFTPGDIRRLRLLIERSTQSFSSPPQSPNG